MRRASLQLLVMGVIIAACGGGSGPAGTSGPATQAPVQPSGAPVQTSGQPIQPSAAPAQPGGTVASVVLVGGPDAGTYSGNAEPNCSHGLIGPEGWGVQYSTVDVDDNGLGSVQIVSAAPGRENDEGAFFAGVSFLMTVTIGPALGETSRDYEVRVSDDDEATGTGSAQIQDNGTTAVVRATGTTEDGVSIDVTINCTSVVRT
jgi:hypothetical protein